MLARLWGSCTFILFALLKKIKIVNANVGNCVINGIRSTPWNGIYCASKAALRSLSEVLFMECKPFNIHVVHLAPGSVKSNLSTNHSQIFNLPPTSLYKSFLDNMVQRMYASQGPESMDTGEFSQTVVRAILRKNPPRILTLGGNVWSFRFLKALPRGLALAILWWVFTKKK